MKERNDYRKLCWLCMPILKRKKILHSIILFFLFRSNSDVNRSHTAWLECAIYNKKRSIIISFPSCKIHFGFCNIEMLCMQIRFLSTAPPMMTNETREEISLRPNWNQIPIYFYSYTTFHIKNCLIDSGSAGCSMSIIILLRSNQVDTCCLLLPEFLSRIRNILFLFDVNLDGYRRKKAIAFSLYYCRNDWCTCVSLTLNCLHNWMAY